MWFNQILFLLNKNAQVKHRHCIPWTIHKERTLIGWLRYCMSCDMGAAACDKFEVACVALRVVAMSCMIFAILLDIVQKWLLGIASYMHRIHVADWKLHYPLYHTNILISYIFSQEYSICIVTCNKKSSLKHYTSWFYVKVLNSFLCSLFLQFLAVLNCVCVLTLGWLEFVLILDSTHVYDHNLYYKSSSIIDICDNN